MPKVLIFDVHILLRIPLNTSTANEIFSFAKEAKAFLESVEIDEKHTRKLPDGTTETYYIRKLAIKSSKFTPFFGFVNNLNALEGIYKDFVLNGPLDEFYTFMFSQDHLETWFSAVRSGLGTCYCRKIKCSYSNSMHRCKLQAPMITQHQKNSREFFASYWFVTKLFTKTIARIAYRMTQAS